MGIENHTKHLYCVINGALPPETRRRLSLEDCFNFSYTPINIRDPKAMYHLLRITSAYSHNVPVNIVMGLPKGSARNGAELLDLETKHQLVQSLTKANWKLESRLAGKLRRQKKADGYERPRSLIKLYENCSVGVISSMSSICFIVDATYMYLRFSKISFPQWLAYYALLQFLYCNAAVIEIDVLQLLAKNDKGYSHCVQIWSWCNYCNRICIVIIPIRLLFWVCSDGEAVNDDDDDDDYDDVLFMTPSPLPAEVHVENLRNSEMIMVVRETSNRWTRIAFP
ncbi:hypothetical protein SO802_003350 [Lithocarpus litseifolius]|uniref:Suv3 C-terminal domain-containing protein n=1 Tax=Lithocarpus litseifolius TaxID=425828 RepID=A0AAW2E5I9_9ROSI